MAETEGVTSAGMATVQQDDRMAKTKQYYPQELDVSDAKDHLRIIDIGESQNLKRNFTTLSIIAVAFDLTNSWVGIATTLAIAIALGGTVTLLYGIILVSFMFLANGITLAELASVYPTAGGQYHFTSVLAPKRFSKALSYCCGLLAAFSWIVTVASVTIILAQVLLAIIIQYTDSYTPETWHYFLVYQAVNALILVYNVYLTKRTTWLYDLGFFWTIALFLVITITCAARSSPKQSSATVWSTFENNSGWSDSISFLTGTSTPQFMYVGLDASLHLAEECVDAARMVPKAIMSAVGIGFVTAFVYAIAMSYSLNDLTSVISTKTGFPTYELWIEATRSDAAATAFMAAMLFAGFIGVNAMQQTASRMTWALARDDALVFSTQLSKVHRRLNVPVQALVFNGAVVLLIGCLYMASTTAFNAFIATCAILQQLSFAMPAALLIYQRRSEKLLPRTRYFRVPNALGLLANWTCVLWTVITTVFYLFPAERPVTTLNMNYAVVVIAIMAIFGLVNWFVHAKKSYRGPRIEY